MRSTVALASGIVHEAGEIVIPSGLRRTRLYRNLVGATLRFLIEQVGEVEGVFSPDDQLPKNFMLRRTAGNGLELIGLATMHASPVWILAALADIAGAGRQLIPEIGKKLVAEGLLAPDARFSTVEQLLDGLQSTSANLAETVNTPPLSVAELRETLARTRDDFRGLTHVNPDDLWSLWHAIEREAAAQQSSVWELSSVMALSAIRTTAVHTTGSLLEHYRSTLVEIHRTGYAQFLGRELSPYVKGAMRQFSSERRTLTERLLSKWRRDPET